MEWRGYICSSDTSISLHVVLYMWQIKLKTISYFYNRRSDLNNLLHSALEAGTFTFQMWIDVLTNYYGKWNAQWFRVIRNLANWWFLQITTHCPLLHILPLPVKILISALILAILALYLLRVESIPKFLMLHSSSKYTKLLSCWKATNPCPHSVLLNIVSLTVLLSNAIGHGAPLEPIIFQG